MSAIVEFTPQKNKTENLTKLINSLIKGNLLELRRIKHGESGYHLAVRVKNGISYKTSEEKLLRILNSFGSEATGSVKEFYISKEVAEEHLR